MNLIHAQKHFRFPAMLFALAFLFSFNSWAAQTSIIAEQSLIYTPEMMLNFNTAEYLKKHAPHLATRAETITHWAGYTTVSPKILIALMEHQTGLLRNNKAADADFLYPFGTLSNQAGFAAQMEEVAEMIAANHYQAVHAASQSNSKSISNSLQKLFTSGNKKLSASSPSVESDLQRLSDVYFGLFGKEQSTSLAPQRSAQSLAPPPANLLQFGYPVGKRWNVGGNHTNTGSGSSPMSSIDFYSEGSGGWGSNTSNFWVVAAAPGSVVVHSSCSVEVIHQGGWSTSYYHLSNVQVSGNQNVSRNQRLANYANSHAQATCQGGSSTGPHVHISVKQNGSHVHMDGFSFSGYVANTSSTNYDQSCSRMWYEKNGSKLCPYSYLVNPGVSGNPPPPPPPKELSNGVPVRGISGANGSETFYTMNVASGASNLSFTSNGGSGDADLYVRFGTKPTTSTYDCRSNQSSNTETCNITNAQTGTYHVLLHGYSAYSGLTLEGSYTTGGPNPGPNEVIVDNSDNNTSSTGTWSASSGSPPYRNNSVYCNSGCTFTWTPSLSSGGSYNVYAWWTTHANRATNVPYTINHSGGPTTVNVNQQSNGGQWILLGTHNFSAGSSDNVTVSSSNGQANADAVRFVKQ